jgi:chromate transporter
LSDRRPGTFALARAWLAVGTQSIGGGSATLYLMRLQLVERNSWLSMREFMEDWALCRLSPGIHIVALAGLIGRRIAGVSGVIVAVTGMMLPAGLITAAMTAGYGAIRDQPLARAALAGIAPITIGMTIGITYVFAKTVMRSGRRGILDAAVLVAAAAGGALVGGSASLLLIVAGAALGAVALGRDKAPSIDAPVT